MGLLGRNGAGKSTLIKLLSSELKPQSGDLTYSQGVKIGYFAQHQLEGLDVTTTPFVHVQRLSPTASDQDIRNFLGGFGFKGDDAFGEVATFSGGEKARLALALVAWQKPNLLLLDEPLAALDAARRQEILPWLAKMHLELKLPMLYVTHSADELARLADHVVMLEQGSVRAAGPVDD
ncbi:ATP-binding cassette domain-containing protein, partial [Cutibacterium acnes]